MKTSRAARDSIDITALENLVHNSVASFGARGCISDEVRMLHPSLAYSSITARYFNLEKQGRIHRPGTVRPGISGRMQQEMWADCVFNEVVIVDDPEGSLAAAKMALYARLAEYVKRMTPVS